jgi:hypothetical protein
LPGISVPCCCYPAAALKRAVLLRKIKMPSDVTISDVVNGILREALAEEIAQVERYQSEGPPPAPRRGRKSRGEE